MAKTMADLAPPGLTPGTREYEDWWSGYLREHRENEPRSYRQSDPQFPAPGSAPTHDPNAPAMGREPSPYAAPYQTTEPDLTRPLTEPPARGSDQYGTTPYTDRGSGTGAADWAYTGYDFGQDPNNRLIGKSAKYTFAEGQRLAKAAGATDSWKTKEGAAEFANQYLKKYLEDNGFEVLDIVGEKMKVRDHADRAAGREGSWIDWVVGADGPNAQLGFQVEGTQEAFGKPETYRPQNFTPTAGMAPISTTQPVGPMQPLGPDPWGRQPGDPLYGQPPAYLDAPMSELAYQELV